MTVAANNEQKAVRFRRGWFLGDSTGSGKGRQIAGIVLDNWCQGRRKAIWVSKSSALIEDARRDWCALGGSEKDIIDLSNIKLGAPIPINEGVLFATYSTLRSHYLLEAGWRADNAIQGLGRRSRGDGGGQHQPS